MVLTITEKLGVNVLKKVKKSNNNQSAPVKTRGIKPKTMKSSELLSSVKGTNFKVRVYSNMEFCVMQDNDRAENSVFAVIACENAIFNDYVNENHPLQTDSCGDDYVEWMNEEFENPFTSYDIDERIDYYEQFNN